VAIRTGRARQWQWVPTTFTFPSGRAPEKQWLRLPDRQLRLLEMKPEPPHIFDGPAYFANIPSRNEVSVVATLCFANRGIYQQEGFGLATRFPFAFLTKTRRIPLKREIVVYPSVEPTDEFFEVLPLINGERESWAHGRGSGLYRIREYTSQDSARHLDWKATAKSGTLMLREFTREDERKLRVIFDNPAAGLVSDATYENAIRLAASLAWHFEAENAELTFASQGFASDKVYDFLAHLAVLVPSAPTSANDLLPLDDTYNLVITGRARGTIPTQWWGRSYFIFIVDRAKRPAAES